MLLLDKYDHHYNMTLRYHYSQISSIMIIWWWW